MLTNINFWKEDSNSLKDLNSNSDNLEPTSKKRKVEQKENNHTDSEIGDSSDESFWINAMLYTGSLW